MRSEIIIQNTGHTLCSCKQEEEIPQQKCIPACYCDGRNKKLQAKEKCCVFCEYGDKPCPTAQQK